MAAKAQPVLEPRQLNEADQEILDELHEGRASPSYLSEQTGVEQTYINQRLRRLDEHGHVENLARGLWELVDDPRDDVNQADEPEPAPLEYVVALETHIEAANEALDNDDPDVAKRHIRAAGDEIGEIRLLDEVVVNERD